jgi:hypothetical protein
VAAAAGIEKGDEMMDGYEFMRYTHLSHPMDMDGFMNGYRSRFTLHARNTVTGEMRNVSVYATDATAAYARGFAHLDAESGSRSWCFDGYTRENT